MTNWHQEVFDNEEEYLVEVDTPRKTFNEMVYCEDCRALVGESNECLCLVAESPSWQDVVAHIQEARNARASQPSSGCGRTDGRTCCGGGCWG